MKYQVAWWLLTKAPCWLIYAREQRVYGLNRLGRWAVHVVAEWSA